jgi:hypothetical protein
MTRHHHIERIKELQCVLTRYFGDRSVRVLGHAWHVADVIDVLEDYVEQLERGDEASTAWFEATAELDERAADIRPLLSAVQDLIIGAEDTGDGHEEDIDDLREEDIDDALRLLGNYD